MSRPLCHSWPTPRSQPTVLWRTFLLSVNLNLSCYSKVFSFILPLKEEVEKGEGHHPPHQPENEQSSFRVVVQVQSLLQGHMGVVCE